MNGAYFEKLVEWQKGKPGRYVSIEMKPDALSVWAFDASLQTGEFLEKEDMPMLEEKADKEARERYNALKARFEDEDR